MSKIIRDDGSTRNAHTLQHIRGIDAKVGQSLNPTDDVTFKSLTVTGDETVDGDLTVDGVIFGVTVDPHSTTTVLTSPTLIGSIVQNLSALTFQTATLAVSTGAFANLGATFTCTTGAADTCAFTVILPGTPVFDTPYDVTVQINAYDSAFNTISNLVAYGIVGTKNLYIQFQKSYASASVTLNFQSFYVFHNVPTPIAITVTPTAGIASITPLFAVELDAGNYRQTELTLACTLSAPFLPCTFSVTLPGRTAHLTAVGDVTGNTQGYVDGTTVSVENCYFRPDLSGNTKVLAGFMGHSDTAKDAIIYMSLFYTVP